MTPENRHQHTARYAVIYRPTSNTAALQTIREKYDPTAELINPHVTLVFPFSSALFDHYRVATHVSSCARQAEQFDARFSRTELSWDQWLFLVADEGRRQFTQLHDRLYTGILRPLLREDIQFVPHISLGYFGVHKDGPDLADPIATRVDADRYRQMLKNFENIDLTYEFRVDHVQLIWIDPQFASTKVLGSFALGA